MSISYPQMQSHFWWQMLIRDLKVIGTVVGVLDNAYVDVLPESYLPAKMFQNAQCLPRTTPLARELLQERCQSKAKVAINYFTGSSLMESKRKIALSLLAVAILASSPRLMMNGWCRALLQDQWCVIPYVWRQIQNLKTGSIPSAAGGKWTFGWDIPPHPLPALA